jgi:hypothetical protein
MFNVDYLSEGEGLGEGLNSGYSTLHFQGYRKIPVFREVIFV